jgi:hypothetical protein
MDGLHISSARAGQWRIPRLLEKAHLANECLVFPDDLSFGPIAGNIAETRAQVRTDFRAAEGKAQKLAGFWRKLQADERPLIVWFSRYSAEELAMLLAICERVQERDIFTVDVGDFWIDADWNGTSLRVKPPSHLTDIPLSVLVHLVGKHVPLDRATRQIHSTRWRSLQAENAPLRVIGSGGLRSAQLDEFDASLLAAVGSEWRRTQWVVRAAEDFSCREYQQIGLLALTQRADELVQQGALEAKGSVSDLWDDDECGLRLPIRSPPPNIAQRPDVLHVTSNSSFGGYLIGALRRAGLDEDVARCPDELSAGPIAEDDAGKRAAWWDGIMDRPEFEEALSIFWQDITQGLPLVIWFGQGHANDICLYHALCDRVPDRILRVGNVSTLSASFTWIDGTSIDLPPPRHLNEVPSIILPVLTAHTTAADPAEIAAFGTKWRELKRENAPIRVLDGNGLTSQPEDYFDSAILGVAEAEWRKTLRILGGAMSVIGVPYQQVGEWVIAARIVRLAETGALDADGDPSDLHHSRVRLAQIPSKPLPS